MCARSPRCHADPFAVLVSRCILLQTQQYRLLYLLLFVAITQIKYLKKTAKVAPQQITFLQLSLQSSHRPSAETNHQHPSPLTPKELLQFRPMHCHIYMKGVTEYVLWITSARGLSNRLTCTIEGNCVVVLQQ